MHKNFKVFTGIRELVSMTAAASGKGRSVCEEHLSPVQNAAMVCVNGEIVWTGPSSRLNSKLLENWGGEKAADTVDLCGATVLPGFVECHTHSVFAGSRAEEFEWRIQGQTYQEIAARGGGIRSTVEQTRRASGAELQKLAQARANRFTQQGVTTLEIKSGYGLDLETEMRSLAAARAVKGPRVVTTYLGAHSRSPERPEFDDYITTMCDQIMPTLAAGKLADRADIYVEKGFFTPAHARKYLARARELGMALTAHVEQLSDSGGAEAALDMQPQSLDHLVYASDNVIRRLATQDTVAVLLPASDLYLRMPYPRARAMIDQGVTVALSTDFNPGTSPTQDLSLVGLLARLEMKMTLPEVIAAFTTGAARALGALDRDSLQVGKLCDFVAIEGSWRELFYAIGHHPVSACYRGGELLSTI